MKRWLKRIRGAVGMGLSWALAWGFVGGLLGGLFFALGGGPAMALAMFTDAGLAGFVLGGSFSVVLALQGRGRAFDEISLERFAIWGAGGGLLLWAPIALGLVVSAGWTAIPGLLVLASVMGVVGAGSAAGSVALARRADPLLEAGEGVGLLEGETFEPST